MTIYLPNHFKPRFSLGKLVITPGAKEALSDEDISFAISRHLRGDWGVLGKQDSQLNEDALENGGRLFSAYEYHNAKVWIITEADRSTTTVRLPDEY